MQLEQRSHTPIYLAIIAPIAAIVAALILCIPLVSWTGVPALQSYGVMLKGALGSGFAISETLSRATPLIFTGLGVAIAFRARFWNIGAEGQFYAGAIAATLFGTGLLPLPSFLLLPLIFVAGFLFGGVLLLLPAILKTRIQVDEVVTTLLFNFIVLLVVSYLVEGPLKDPSALGWPQATPVIAQATLPRLVGRTHWGLIIALVCAILVWLMNSRMVLGYRMRAIGANQTAALFAGIPIQRVILYTALLSGGLAGMGGVSEVAGLKGYLSLDLSPGFGYTGIIVAMLAQLNAIGVVFSALFIAAIYVGADAMSRSANLPSYLADVIVSTSLLCMLVSILLTRYRLRWK
ncbi:ABC transporter permease [Kovacikia minuta CCNUW1]|uniref:ABC transporter permease n=1 Tax=Kovacikia minuta TaxID=2931930 RepID=UPI001CCC4DD0|nr:ABC transporter permease [Kovacikia minuta]UBF23694.1 ABC transporter permease [Kovacikia minuta CCNUW1]